MADKKPPKSKLYHSISEVAKQTGVKAHVLRYWESEFPTLRPKKTRSGSRRYRQSDIDEILAIKELLYDQGFRIAGARKLRNRTKYAGKKVETEAAPQMRLGFADMDSEARLEHVREELKGVLELIRGLGPAESRTGRKTASKAREEEA
jgi:DNA-binding transcriptional MerR regulator